MEADGSVVACDNIKEASQFYILPTDSKGHPYEFYIAYFDNISPTPKSSGSDINSTLGSIARYLQAPCNMRGTNKGPLYACHHGTQDNCRFAIHSRLVSGKAVPLALPSWTSGRDIFFINCLGRKRRIDGYLCVRQSQGSKYITSCVSGTSAHNGHSIFMLFRLLPGSYSEEENAGKNSANGNDPINEASEYEEDGKREVAQMLEPASLTLKTDELSSHSTEIPMLEIHQQ